MKSILIGILFAMLVSSCKYESPLIPRALLFGNPEKASAQISPDGNKIAYLAPDAGVLNIWIRSVQGGDDRPITQDRERGIFSYFWSWDSRYLMFLQDQNGDENTHLYSVEIESREKKDLTPFPGVRVQVLGSDKHSPDILLISMNREKREIDDVYRLNLRTGALDLAAKNDGTISGWISDKDLKVRGALAANTDGGYTVRVRDSESAPWKEIAKWGFEDAFNCNVAGFSKDGKDLYLIDSRDAPVSRLVRLNLATGEKSVLAEDPSYDVTGVVLNPETLEVRMVTWSKEKTEWKVFEEAVRTDIETILKRHGPGFSITSGDEADQNWVLRVESDREPVSYFLYQRKNRESKFLFQHQSALNQYSLAEIEPISFQSRDNLEIHGYITFPPGKERKNLPMVLKVHGGPWNRDGWGYDPRVQWLANRGYICLQVNFRGSVTYGKAFLNAGNKEWGGKMQNDLTDAVEWAIRQGYADPKRVAIFGGSYGGYAALAGAVFTPDLFRAAISVVGPSNLISFLNTTPPYWSTELENIRRRVGNPETEIEFLKSRSPYFHADRIRIPMLIAQGANDPRVKKAESDQIVEALKKHGVPHEYLLFEDEGHGFARPENQLRFYKTAEAFLAKHLGGRAES